MYPHGRVSEVQRRQMTTVEAPNIHAIALEGTFDDCQAILKGLFNNHGFRDGLRLSGVNSINWARVVAQTVYYFTSAAVLGGPHRKVSYTVPTGNFGDALAGYVASRAGLLNSFRITAAVNANDAMARLLSGQPLTRGETAPTISPAMDIQLPSNFERLFFEATSTNGDPTARNGAIVAKAYAELAAKGQGAIPADVSARLASMGLDGQRVSDAETREEMKRTLAETGWVVCPHTAVGLAAARRVKHDGPVVTLATAHAAKVPETVHEVLGVDAPLPPRAHAFASRTEKFDTGPMSADFVRDRILSIAAKS
jgi:threonine synthase